MKTLVALVLSGAALFATSWTHAQPQPPTGQWRCVVNAYWGGIDLVMQVQPNNTLYGRGTILYAGTSASYSVQGRGDWTALPPDQYANEWLFKFRMFPSNHRIFDWYARPTDNPDWLYNTFQAQNGAVTETSCTRVQG